MTTTAVVERPQPAGPQAVGLSHRLWLAPLVAVTVVGIGLALGWRGVDVAASVHRIDEYRRYGFALWDAAWYGGQWTLNYSVVFAPVASALGLPVISLLAAAVAAFSFQYLIEPRGSSAQRLAPAALAAGVVFAVGTVVQTSIGQLPYLSGEAVGLAAMAAARRRLWLPAWALALGASLLSPLAGLFVALAAGAWAIHVVCFSPPATGGPIHLIRRARQVHRAREGSAGLDWRQATAVAGLGLAAGLPIVATTVLFPMAGQMPFQSTNLLWDLIVAAIAGLAGWDLDRRLRVGVVVYGAALIASWAFSSPLGTNVGRLGDVLALPVVVLALWSRRRILLGLLAVPLIASSWVPALDAMTPSHTTPSTSEAFYRPLDRWLSRVDPAGIDGRVEVVPTFYHWESVWVAQVVPLARGWERQSDVSFNPIFYRPGAIEAGAYDRWLLDNGVRWVAVPNAALDFAGVQEAKLVAAGVPGLTPAWHDADWKVYGVDGSTGLVAGDAALRRLGNSSVTVEAKAAGLITVRVRATSDWRLASGAGCLTTTPGGWIGLHVPRAETVQLHVALSGPSAGCAGNPAAVAGAGRSPTG